MNVECQTIRVPTGVQDYRPALYGGIAAVELGVDGMTRVGLDVDPAELERRIVVAYTGAPRNSGTNNWEITKRHLDGDQQVFDCFERIRDTATAMRRASSAATWDEVGRQIAQRMAEPEAARARRHHARHRRCSSRERKERGPPPPRCVAQAAAVVCSATALLSARSAIAEALAAGGARILDYRIETEGLLCG